MAGGQGAKGAQEGWPSVVDQETGMNHTAPVANLGNVVQTEAAKQRVATALLALGGERPAG